MMVEGTDAEALPTTFNILFVCTGNTCRSPMAEAIARDELRTRGWKHVSVASAGIAADPGQRASPHAAAVVSREGLDLSGHRARRLDAEIVAWADLILCMSPSHLDPVADLGGATKMDLLSDFASEDGRFDRSVRDPFGGDERAYDDTKEQLKALVSLVLDRVAPIVHP